MTDEIDKVDELETMIDVAMLRICAGTLRTYAELLEQRPPGIFEKMPNITKGLRKLGLQMDGLCEALQKQNRIYRTQ